ncbi:MAG: ABC transporter ATP-binding protein [Pseudomonadota bacterium]
MTSLTSRPYAFWRFSYFLLWKEAWVYAGSGERRSIILYHLMYVVAVAMSLVQPYILGRLVNTLQTGGTALFHDAAMLLGAIVLAEVGFWVFHGPARIIERKAAKNIYIAYTTQCYARLMEMPLNWHQDHHSGSTINRIQTAANGLQDFVQNGFTSFQNLGLLTGSIIVLLWFNPIIGLASLAGFVFSMCIIVAMNKRMIAALHESNEVAHQASATFYDFVSNMASIIILRVQKLSERTLRSRLALSMSPWMKQIKLNEGRYFVYTMLNILMMTVILLGYIKAQIDLNTVVAAGSLVTVYLYQEKIGYQGFNFLGIHEDWIRGLTNLSAAKNFLEEHAGLAGRGVIAPQPGWKQLDIRHLYFNYRADDGSPKPVLSDIHLPLRRGERIALIGGSGGGKSTLLSLLRALHEPESGELYIDGQPVPFNALSEVTTLIPQDPEIFENTIRFNVSFDLDVPDEQVYQAIRLAEFTSVLEQMPRGLDTDIREKGVNLSVGQKQRLALARGIFAAGQSDIVLLDEPTSSIDLPTEEKIFENIFARFEGKTIVATLHRLNLLPGFDRIVYLEGGAVLSDLPAKEALFRKGPILDIYLAYQQKAV